jgi:hypothetical protein
MKPFGIVTTALLLVLTATAAFAQDQLAPPFRFEPNEGQAPAEVKYVVSGGAGKAELTADAIVLGQEHSRLVLQFKGANAESTQPLNDLNLISNYYSAGRSAHTGIRNYERVTYKNLYPGIDAVFYGSSNKLEFDFIVSPGADTNAIDLAIRGSQTIQQDKSGDLILGTADGNLTLSAPRVYQDFPSGRKPVEGRLILKTATEVGFAAGGYDHSQPLVIDPTLTLSTYTSHDNTTEYPNVIRDDSGGNVYLTFIGLVSCCFTDVRVQKISRDGSPGYITDFGINTLDRFVMDLAVDSSRNVYAVGKIPETMPNTPGPLPTKNAIQPLTGGGGDGFAFKLDATGAVVFLTYLGGSGTQATSVALDPLQTSIYILATSTSGTSIKRMSADGQSFISSTPATSGTKLYLDPAGNMYVGAPNGLVKMNAGGSVLWRWNGLVADFTVDGNDNAFILRTDNSTSLQYLDKLDANGNLVATSNALPGYAFVNPAVDPAGNVYVTGGTSLLSNSTIPLTPVINSFQQQPNNSLLVLKLSPDLKNYLYSTFINGSTINGPNGPAPGGVSRGTALAIDGASRAYVGGWTNALDFPTTNGSKDPEPGAEFFVPIALVLDPGVPDTTPRYTVLEQNYFAIQYSGDWYTNNSPYDSGGSAVLAEGAGATATLSFTGSGTVRWFGCKDGWSGIARVTVDGNAQTVDTYSATATLCNFPIWSTTVGSGSHTITIAVTGTKNPAAQAPWIWVDKFEITSAGDIVIGPGNGGSGGNPSFTILDVSPTSSAAPQGGSTNYAVTIGAFNGFNGTVTLGTTGLPSGTTGVFNPPTINGAGRSILTVSATSTASIGAFVLNVSGTSGSLSDSEAVSFRVIPGSTTTTWTRVEQTNAAIQYSGDWYNNSNSNESGGSAYLTLAGSATFSFSGTGARWVGFSDSYSGIANVYVDGALKGSIDTYSNTTKYQVLQYTITGLASGNHTLVVQATGQHNSAAASAWVWVDGFDSTSDGGGGGGNPDFSLTVTPSSANVSQGGSTTYSVSVTPSNGFSGTISLSAAGFGSGASGSFNPSSIPGSGSSTFTVTATSTAQTGAFPLTITASGGGVTHTASTTLNVNPAGGTPNWTRIEQNNAAIQYADQWYSNTSSSESGGSAYLALSGSATLSFSGTAVRWIGFSDSYSGIANVYIDGVLKTSADTYSSGTKYQAVQYTITGLTPGSHTIRIEVTGQRDSSASSAWIWVDGFDVAQ